MFSLSKLPAFILTVGVLTTPSAFATDLGTPVQLAVDNGIPKLGVQYAYESDAIMLSVTGTVQTQSLPGGGKPNFVAMYDTKTNKLTSDWLPLGVARGNQLNAFSFALDRKATLRTLRAFPDVVMVVTSDVQKIEANLDLGKLCSQFPGNFLDMTQSEQGCHPDKETLSSLPEDVGGLCSADLHKKYCAATYDAVRDAIAKQKQCVFKCN